MAYFNKDTIERVKQIDVLTYLQVKEPGELVHYKGETYTTATHDSLKISNGMWYWFSRGIGGKTALEYLIQVREYTFTQAVEILLGETYTPYKREEKLTEKNLILPKKADNNRKAKEYLMSRGIDESIIQQCIDDNLIYQQYPNNNVVFLGLDNNKIPRYAAQRGTNSSRYMQEATGSHKAFSFKIEPKNNTDTLHIFESCIDLLSYATLLKIQDKEWYNQAFLSLAGVYKTNKNIDEIKLPLALNLYLNNNKNIKKIILHLDNDATGRLATESLKKAIIKEYEVIDNPPPKGKDYNDFLCMFLNINYKKENIREDR